MEIFTKDELYEIEQYFNKLADATMHTFAHTMNGLAYGKVLVDCAPVQRFMNYNAELDKKYRDIANKAKEMRAYQDGNEK